MGSTFFVVYCSPAGTTRRTARWIEQSLVDAGARVDLLDLGMSGGRSAFVEMIRGSRAGDCLIVGSPVYRDVAVPPVMGFIAGLPEVDGTAAVPFVTWGAVTSGVALWQMGRGLAKKGFVLAGGAAVVSEHCMMWRSATPSGAGRPDDDDRRRVRAFARQIAARVGNGAVVPLDPDALDYQSRHHAAEMKQKIDQPWRIVPKTVAEDKCTECGICEEECPVGAIRLSPKPLFDETCFDCFNCLRLCPEEAIDSPLSAEGIEEHIAQLKEKYREVPETKIFLPA